MFRTTKSLFIRFCATLLLAISILLLYSFLAYGQQTLEWLKKKKSGASGTTVTAITLDASCTGTGSAQVVPCSSAMTVTAGDTITCEGYDNGSSFDPSNLIFNDTTNGFYSLVTGYAHTSSGDAWVATAVFENSAGGSITPQIQNWESDGMGISCQAWKGTRSSSTIDTGGVNLTKSATAANPTAGTAASPTNANEAIICQLVRATAAATSNSGSWLPSGTLTGVTNTFAQYFEYQIQTTATSVNCPYTSASAGYRDTQFAVYNSSSSAGARGLTGVYGIPAVAQTNGATATLAILNTITGSAGMLTALNGPSNPGGWWTQLSGSAVTFDTSVAPIGTQKFVVNGVSSTIGGAATSIHFPAANITTSYALGMEGIANLGSGVWLGSFFRMGSGIGSTNGCDTFNLDGTAVEGAVTTQIHWATGTGLYYLMEINSGGTPSVTHTPGTTINLSQDYYFIIHVAGVNEANDEVYILGESTPGTLPWIVLDHFTYPKAGPVQATTTATQATVGSTSIVVASATGIRVGEGVWTGTGSVGTGEIPVGTTVTSVSGTTIGISNPTSLSMSSTPLMFTGAAWNDTGSVTSGSTTLTVSSGSGVATGQIVAMAGVPTGTIVVSGSGTSWVMSQKATSTQSSVTVNFWSQAGGTVGYHFGKYSSCSSGSDEWFSGQIFDFLGTLLPLVVAGTISL